MKTILTILVLTFSLELAGQPVSPGERIIYLYDKQGQLLSDDNKTKSKYKIAVEYDRTSWTKPDTVINSKGQFGGFFDPKPYTMTIYLIHKNDTMAVAIKDMGTYFTLDGIKFQPGQYEISNQYNSLQKPLTIKNWDIYKK